MWQRWNQTTHIFEKSTDNGGSWIPLPLDASILSEGSLNPLRLGNPIALPVGTVKVRYGDLSSAGHAHVAYNISFDGTNWNLDDTGKIGWLGAFSGSADGFYLFRFAPGANPSPPLQKFVINNNGDHLLPNSSSIYFSTFTGANLRYYGDTNLAVVRMGATGFWMQSSAGAVVWSMDPTGLQSLVSGIKFPAAQNASADVNTLDDYEEGTFTPQLSSDGGGSCTYTQQGGNYVKIGRFCFVAGRIIINVDSWLAGNMYLTGMPFNVGTQWGGGTMVYYTSLNIVTQSLNFYLIPAVNYGLITIGQNAGGIANLQAADIVNGSDFIFHGWYLTDN